MPRAIIVIKRITFPRTRLGVRTGERGEPVWAVFWLRPDSKLQYLCYNRTYSEIRSTKRAYEECQWDIEPDWLVGEGSLWEEQDLQFYKP